jgi:hypothetical protein
LFFLTSRSYLRRGRNAEVTAFSSGVTKWHTGSRRSSRGKRSFQS